MARRPFRCSHCQRTFVRKSDRTRHTKFWHPARAITLAPPPEQPAAFAMTGMATATFPRSDTPVPPPPMVVASIHHRLQLLRERQGRLSKNLTENLERLGAPYVSSDPSKISIAEQPSAPGELGAVRDTIASLEQEMNFLESQVDRLAAV